MAEKTGFMGGLFKRNQDGGQSIDTNQQDTLRIQDAAQTAKSIVDAALAAPGATDTNGVPTDGFYMALQANLDRLDEADNIKNVGEIKKQVEALVKKLN